MTAGYFKVEVLLAVALNCALVAAISRASFVPDLHQYILGLNTAETAQMHALINLVGTCTESEDIPGVLAPTRGVAAYMIKRIDSVAHEDSVHKEQFVQIYAKEVEEPCRLTMRIVDDLVVNEDEIKQNLALWQARTDYVGDIARAYQLCSRIGRFLNADTVYKAYQSAKLTASAAVGLWRSDSRESEPRRSGSSNKLGSPKKVVAAVKKLF